MLRGDIATNSSGAVVRANYELFSVSELRVFAAYRGDSDFTTTKPVAAQFISKSIF